jgi:hypothetical protein
MRSAPEDILANTFWTSVRPGLPALGDPLARKSSAVHIKIKSPVTKILLTYRNGLGGHRHGYV